MFGKILIFLSIFMLGSCVQLKPPNIKQVKDIDTESLLEVDGHWNLVEKSQSYDPTKAHLQARKNVNINRRGKKADLSAHFTPNAKSGKDGKLRVLRLEPQRGVSGDVSSYEVADVKPASVVTRKKPISKDFGGVIVTPPAMPKRKMASILLPVFDDVIIPKRKPAFAAFDSGVPIPKVKPLIIGKGVSVVSKLRAGAYSGNVRIVMEVSDATKYKVAIDDLRNVFRMKLENTSWDISPKGVLKDSDLLGTYVARNQDDGNVLLEVRLKNNAEIVNSMVLRSNKTPNYRIVIDLKPL